MEAEAAAVAASAASVFLLPSCTIPYRHAAIRGLGNWMYLALQRPAHWPERRLSSHVQIIVALENAAFRMRWRSESSGLVLGNDFNGEYVCIVPCGFHHELEWRAEAPILMFFVDAAWVKRLIQRPVSDVSIEPLRRYAESEGVIGDLCRSLRHRGCRHEPTNAETIAGLGSALVSELLLANMPFLQKQPCPEPRLSQVAMDKIAAYVRDHLVEKMTLAVLARQLGLSPSYFGQLFRASFGESPMSYVIARRIWRARELLSVGDCTVKEIAYAVGFADQSQMARHFRGRRLAPPRTYLPSPQRR